MAPKGEFLIPNSASPRKNKKIPVCPCLQTGYDPRLHSHYPFWPLEVMAYFSVHSGNVCLGYVQTATSLVFVSFHLWAEDFMYSLGTFCFKNVPPFIWQKNLSHLLGETYSDTRQGFHLCWPFCKIIIVFHLLQMIFWNRKGDFVHNGVLKEVSQLGTVICKLCSDS